MHKFFLPLLLAPSFFLLGNQYQVVTLASSGLGSLPISLALAQQPGDQIQFNTGPNASTLQGAYTVTPLANISMYLLPQTGYVTIPSGIPFAINTTVTLGNLTQQVGSSFIFQSTITVNSPGSLILADGDIDIATIILNNNTALTYNTTPNQLALIQAQNSTINISPSAEGVTDELQPLNCTINIAPGTNYEVGKITNYSGNTLSGFILTGGGELILGGGAATYSYQGPTTLSAGTLLLGGSSNISSSSNIDLFGGTIDLTNSNVPIQLNNVQSNIGSQILMGSQPLTLNNTLNPTYFAGAINGPGSGSINISGYNVQFASPCSYPGQTIINSASSLLLSNQGSITNSSGVTINSGATFEVSNTASVNNITGSGNISISGTLNAIYNAFTTFNGVIQGAGTFNKTGAGELYLSGTNTFSGNYIVSQGTLAILGSGSIAAGNSVQLTSGTTLDLSNVTGSVTIPNLQGVAGSQVSLSASHTTSISITTASNYLGSIDGSGQITISGTGSNNGSLTLGGNCPYSGATVVTNAYFGLSGSGTIPNSSSVTVNSGAVLDVSQINASIGINNFSGDGTLILGTNGLTVINNTSSLTFSGSITGSGAAPFNKSGTGTLNLSGNNPYSSPTTINGGTLALLSGGSITNSSSVTIDSGATFDTSSGPNTVQNLQGNGILALGTSTLTSNYTSTVTASLQFSGSGTFELGGGTLNLIASDDSFAGTFSVPAGTLQLNATFNSTDVIIGTGGQVSGNATVNNMTNSGILSPGNSIGTMIILGNYQQNGGEVVTEINSLGQADLVQVGNNALLLGNASIVPEPGLYQIGDSYTLLTYGGTLTGTYDLVLDPRLKMYLDYSTPNVILLVNDKKTHIVPVDPSNLPDYPRSIADALFCDNVPSGSELDQIKESILLLNTSQYITSLTRLVPAQISGIPIVEIENTNRINALIQNRIYRFNSDFCDISADLPEWTFWFTPTTFWLWQKDHDATFAFHSNTAGITLGFENNIYENILLGLGTGYSYSGITWSDSLGNALLNEFYLAPYAAGRWNNFYFAGSIMGSYDRVRLKRHLQNNGYVISGVEIAGYNRIATSYLNQWNLTAMLDAKTHLYLKNSPVYMAPQSTITFAQLFRQSANESGAGTLDMTYPSGFNSTMRINLNWAAGIRSCYQEDLIIDAKASIGYQYTDLFTSNDVKASFIAINQVCDEIDVYGNRPTPSQGVATLSADIQKKDFLKSELKASYTFGGWSSVVELDLSFEFQF
ncbi:MAG: autotransporter domain-containing protein [Chlamydiia bacterium]